MDENKPMNELESVFLAGVECGYIGKKKGHTIDRVKKETLRAFRFTRFAIQVLEKVAPEILDGIEHAIGTKKRYERTAKEFFHD